MALKQTIPTTGGDYLQFGNATTPVAAQVGGYEDSTGNGHLELYTTTGGVSTERLRIDSSGNVGIGTSSPGAKLVIEGGTSADQFRMGTGSNYYKIGRESVSTGFLNFYGSQTGANGYVFGGVDGERMRIDSSGNLLVGTTSSSGPSSGFAIQPASGGSTIHIGHANGTPSGYSYMGFFYNSGAIGSISQNGTTATAYNTSSDYRLKENIAPMVGALDTVAKLKPVTYNWKIDGSDGQGFIAHELQAVVPDCVTGEKDAVDAEGKPVYQGIDTSFLVATLTAAIQELTAKVAALEAKVGA